VSLLPPRSPAVCCVLQGAPTGHLWCCACKQYHAAKVFPKMRGVPGFYASTCTPQVVQGRNEEGDKLVRTLVNELVAEGLGAEEIANKVCKKFVHLKWPRRSLLGLAEDCIRSKGHEMAPMSAAEVGAARAEVVNLFVGDDRVQRAVRDAMRNGTGV
jgi:hypothetical protein